MPTTRFPPVREEVWTCWGGERALYNEVQVDKFEHVWGQGRAKGEGREIGYRALYREGLGPGSCIKGGEGPVQGPLPHGQNNWLTDRQSWLKHYLFASLLTGGKNRWYDIVVYVAGDICSIRQTRAYTYNCGLKDDPRTPKTWHNNQSPCANIEQK